MNKRWQIQTSNGFTLIEIMIVVVVIGLLAAIVALRGRQGREAAHIAAMKSDLRNLLGAEMIYYSDSSSFSPTAPLLFITSAGVTGPTIAVSGQDLTAWVGSTQTSKTCAIFLGNTSLAPATREGEPRCT